MPWLRAASCSSSSETPSAASATRAEPSGRPGSSVSTVIGSPRSAVYRRLAAGATSGFALTPSVRARTLAGGPRAPVGRHAMSAAVDDLVGSALSFWRYPVKSMMGEELNATEITDAGVLGDRAFA